MITRRRLIGTLGCLLAAPTIVRASSLMPVRAPKVTTFECWGIEDVRYQCTERYTVTWFDARATWAVNDYIAAQIACPS